MLSHIGGFKNLSLLSKHLFFRPQTADGASLPDLRPSTFDIRHSTFDFRLSTFDLRPSTFDFKQKTSNLKLQTSNKKSPRRA
jgi:hypothetical protein